jgi:hypothetical protein
MHIKELVICVYNGKEYDAEKLFVIEISASTVWWAKIAMCFPSIEPTQ